MVLQSLEDDRPTGRIQARAARWMEFLSPTSFLAKAVTEGFRLELWLAEPLVQRRAPHQFRLEPTHQQAITEMVTSLLARGIIERVPDRAQHHVFAPVFAVEKRGSTAVRPIYDARFLNRFITKRKFKQETLLTARDLVRPGDFFCKVDLKDAYFHMTVHPSHTHLLAFMWEGVGYRYKSLPFGVSSAPRLFTKLLRPVMGQLRRQGIRCVIYLDDLLVIASSKEQAERETRIAVELLHALGFLISWKKSILVATQTMEFLGVIIDTVRMELRLSVTKLDGLRTRAQTLHQAACRSAPVRTKTLASVLGSFTSCLVACAVTRLKTRELHRCLRTAVNRAGSYSGTATLTPRALTELEWWRDTLWAWNGRSLLPDRPAQVFASDASDFGWGMTRLKGREGGLKNTHGFWQESEHALHNNPKELRGISYGLRAWIHHLNLSDTVLHVRTDNTVALSYVLKQGGRIPELGAVAEELWAYCLDRNIRLTADHIPGVLNTLADKWSRKIAGPSECRLTDKFFALLQRRRGPFSIDLFASRTNARLPRYYSRYPDPGAEATDALAQDWTREQAYCFPPFPIIGQVLRKLHLEGGRMLLVVPSWHAQSWWPSLLALVDREVEPIHLPAASIDNPARWDALPPSDADLCAWMLSAPSGPRGSSHPRPSIC